MSDPITQAIVTGLVQGVTSATAKHVVGKALNGTKAKKQEASKKAAIARTHEMLKEDVRKAEEGNFFVGKARLVTASDIEAKTEYAKRKLAEFEETYSLD